MVFIFSVSGLLSVKRIAARVSTLVCVEVIFVVGRAAGFVMFQLAAAVPICRSTPIAMAAGNGKR